MKKRKLEVVVISDIHLGTPDCRTEELLIYLSSIKPRILVLNGGFLGRSEGKNHYPKSHIKVIKKILSMLTDGTKVYYLTGGRDGSLAKLTGEAMSNLRFEDRLILNLNGKETCILHGDIFDTSPLLAKWLGNLGNAGYRALFLYRRFTRGHFSLAEKKWEREDPNIKAISSPDLGLLSKFDRTAATMAVLNGFDTMICGYTQQPRKAVFENSKGECLYLNTGGWTRHLTALEYSFKRWKVYNFRLDKLTAFYGDEELAEINIPELLRQMNQPSNPEENPRTAS